MENKENLDKVAWDTNPILNASILLSTCIEKLARQSYISLVAM